jgi:hypothetical protein
LTWATGSDGHDVVWYALDVTSFPNGATLTVNGMNGSGVGTSSTYLVNACSDVPSSGGGFSTLENSSDTPPETAWDWSYSFPAGSTLLYLGGECGWGTAQGGTNTDSLTVTVN